MNSLFVFCLFIQVIFILCGPLPLLETRYLVDKDPSLLKRGWRKGFQRHGDNSDRKAVFASSSLFRRQLSDKRPTGPIQEEPMNQNVEGKAEGIADTEDHSSAESETSEESQNQLGSNFQSVKNQATLPSGRPDSLIPDREAAQEEEGEEEAVDIDDSSSSESEIPRGTPEPT